METIASTPSKLWAENEGKLKIIFPTTAQSDLHYYDHREKDMINLMAYKPEVDKTMY